jgi:hypothetical protein
VPKTGGPGPAQTTPMTHISANRAHRHGCVAACSERERSLKEGLSGSYARRPGNQVTQMTSGLPEVGECVAILGRAYGRVLDFSFGSRTENGYDMAFEFVSAADFRYVLHHFSRLTRLKGSLGPSLAGKRSNTQTKTYISIS